MIMFKVIVYAALMPSLGPIYWGPIWSCLSIGVCKNGHSVCGSRRAASQWQKLLAALCSESDQSKYGQSPY